MSEYPDSRLRLPVFVCFRLYQPAMTGPPVITGVVEDARGDSSGATPPRTRSVLRDTLDSIRDVNHMYEGTSKNFPHFEY